MQGRRPKSRYLKLLMGTPNAGRLNYAEPIPAANLGEPPDWLTPEEQADWISEAGTLPAGVLKRADRTLFTDWIKSRSTYKRAAQARDKLRSMLSTKYALYTAVMHREARLQKALATELGMSPAARPRLQATPDVGVNEFEKLMG